MIQQWEFKETDIADLYEIQPFNAEDVRGCFTKDYSQEVFVGQGIEHNLAEVFYTTSRKGVIRALHFQREKQQPKLVRCIWGHVWDVVVDLRKDSPTFIVSYKCAEKFYGEYDDGVLWNDSDIAVSWPLEKVGGIDKVILADKDKNLQSFAQFMDTYGGF